MAKEAASSSSETENNDELEQITIARALLNYRLKEKMAIANSPSGTLPFPKKFPQNLRSLSPQPPPVTTSKILPLICQKTPPRNRPPSPTTNDGSMPSSQPRSRPTSTTASESPVSLSHLPSLDGRAIHHLRFPAAGAAPYVPIRQFRAPYHGIAQPVTIRNAVPVFSAPPSGLPPQVMRTSHMRIAPPVCVRQAVPVFAAPPARKEDPVVVQKEDTSSAASLPSLPAKSPAPIEETNSATANNLQEFEAVRSLEQLKI